MDAFRRYVWMLAAVIGFLPCLAMASGSPGAASSWQITITADPPGPVCAGTPVKFTATAMCGDKVGHASLHLVVTVGNGTPQTIDGAGPVSLTASSSTAGFEQIIATATCPRPKTSEC